MGAPCPGGRLVDRLLAHHIIDPRTGRPASGRARQVSVLAGSGVSGGSLTDPKARYDWLHTDHLGTPILATTKEGQVSWKAIAESFGSTQIIGQDIEVNLRFPGQYFDAETGTHYNFHRDYRPNAGRYLQEDQ